MFDKVLMDKTIGDVLKHLSLMSSIGVSDVLDPKNIHWTVKGNTLRVQVVEGRRVSSAMVYISEQELIAFKPTVTYARAVQKLLWSVMRTIIKETLEGPDPLCRYCNRRAYWVTDAVYRPAVFACRPHLKKVVQSELGIQVRPIYNSILKEVARDDHDEHRQRLIFEEAV